MRTGKTKKILISIIIVAIIILSYANIINSFFIEKTYIRHIDREAKEYLDDTMKKALVTFAIVRGINAIISVIQDSEVAVSPAGVGITIAVGQILDPINDLIERFSWVMLASTTSLGIQKILMNIGKWLGFQALLSLSMIAILLGLWFPKLLNARLRPLGVQLLVAAVIIRFCIPVVALATSGIDTLFLHGQYDRATQSLKEVSDAVVEDDTEIPLTTSDSNVIHKIKNFFKNIEYAANFEEKIQDLKDTLSGYTEYIVDLIVVFILQTIVVPLIMLWLLIRLASGLFGTNLMEKLKPIFIKQTFQRKPAG
jgi:hypothetical protein